MPPPLHPRKGLFVALCTALALWAIFLLVLYFTTVRPNSGRDALGWKSSVTV